MALTVHDRDFFYQPFSEAELRGLAAHAPPGDAFAWNSARDRAMNLSRTGPPRNDERTPCRPNRRYLEPLSGK